MAGQAAGLPRQWAGGALAVGVLAATMAISAIGAWLDLLPLLLVGAVVLAAFIGAMIRPTLLFYMYCAAIPLNFALPPGPAGTVARIAGIAFFVGYLARRPDSLRPAVVPLAGWLFVGWALASTQWALDTQTAYLNWLSIVQLFAITVLIASLVAVTPEVVGAGLWSYAVMATATAAIGIITYLDGGEGSFGRGTAFAGQDPALFASLVLPAAVFLMGETASKAGSPLRRVGAAAALTVCIGALAVSGTRSAWIGMIVGTCAWLVLQRDRRQLVAIGTVALAVLLLVVAVPGVQDFLAGRAASSVASGGSGRTEIWVVGLSIVASAPILGVGFGNFPVAFTPYAIAHTPGAVLGGALVPGRAPHNVLLGISAETGIIGGALLVLLVVTALLHSGGPRGNVVRAALIGLVVQAMFLDILQQKQVWLFLAIALGLGAAERLRSAPERWPAPQPPRGSSMPVPT